MNRKSLNIVVITLAFVGCAFCGWVRTAPAAVNDVVVYNFTNPSPTSTITDVSLLFNKSLATKKVVTTFVPIRADSVVFGAGTGTTGNIGPPPNSDCDFSANGKSIPAKGKDTYTIEFPPESTKGIQLTTFSYTFLSGTPGTLAKPKIDVTVGKKDDGFVSITNDDTQTVYFAHMMVATDLPSSDFDLDSTTLDNNDLFANTPESDFSLAPGQTMEYDLALDPGDEYTSAYFSYDFALPTADSPEFGAASNEEVPEPASIGILLSGSALLLRRARR